jgi:hypothetical protein
MTRRNLQILMWLLVPVPVVTGLIGMMGVGDPLYAGLGLDLPHEPTFDSNLRFLGGVWCGLGLAAAWTIPRIERETALFRTVWGAIFVGGVGRLLSIALVGAPLAPFIGFTALEIIGAPLIVLWQAKVARATTQP